MGTEGSAQKQAETSERKRPSLPFRSLHLSPPSSHAFPMRGKDKFFPSPSQIASQHSFLFSLINFSMGDEGYGTPPHPKSPPEYPDVLGKHRLMVTVQTLNKEIRYLEHELNSMEGTVPASRCCKELNEFINTNPDPLIKVYEKRNKPKPCSFWNFFRAILCCNWGWICCASGCMSCPKRPKRCCCTQLKNIICCKWCCMGCTGCNCCKISSCNFDPMSPCLECSCGCVCSCSRCIETCVCPRCTGCCCKGRCIF